MKPLMLMLMLTLFVFFLVSVSVEAQTACYIRTSTSCAKPLWQPDFSVPIASNPVAITREFYSGALSVQVCQQVAGSTGCIPVERGPCLPCTFWSTTLAGWCAALKALPVPPLGKLGQQTDLYSDFRIGGVCP